MTAYRLPTDSEKCLSPAEQITARAIRRLHAELNAGECSPEDARQTMRQYRRHHRSETRWAMILRRVAATP